MFVFIGHLLFVLINLFKFKNKKTIECKIIKSKSKPRQTRQNIPPIVRRAFRRLLANETKASIARKLHTSPRSIGRWMIKYDYEAYRIRYSD